MNDSERVLLLFLQLTAFTNCISHNYFTNFNTSVMHITEESSATRSYTEIILENYPLFYRLPVPSLPT